MEDRFSFEKENGERVFEFPVVAVKTDGEDAQYEVKRIHSISPTEDAVKRALSQAYDYSDPGSFPEGHMVGTVSTDEDGTYKGAGFNAHGEQSETPSWTAG